MRRRLLGSVKGLFIPNHQIWYTTTDGEIAEINDVTGYGANIISNVYKDGKGVVEFDSAITKTSFYMFRGATNLETVTLPNSVLDMQTGGFYECTSLKTVKLPEGVTRLDSLIFYGCTSLEKVEIPKSATVLGSGVFSGGCTGEVTVYCNLASIEAASLGKFADSNLSKIIFGSGVTSIGDYALSGLNIQEVEFPDTLQSLGEYALSECRSLKNITVKAIVAPAVTGTTFRYIGEDGVLKIPTGSDYSTWMDKLSAYGWTSNNIVI